MADEPLSYDEESLEDSDDEEYVRQSVLSDANIPYLFVNNAFIDINENDISVVFMYDYSTPDGPMSKPGVRLAFTHAGFINLVEFMNTRATFLKKVYGGKPRSAFQTDSDVFADALREIENTKR